MCHFYQKILAAILKVFDICIVQSLQLFSQYTYILFGPKETTVAMDDGRAAWRSIFAQLLCAAEYSTMPDSYHSKNTPGNCCPSVHNSLDSQTYPHCTKPTARKLLQVPLILLSPVSDVPLLSNELSMYCTTGRPRGRRPKGWMDEAGVVRQTDSCWGGCAARNKNPKIKNGFEYGGTLHRLQKQTLITIL